MRRITLTRLESSDHGTFGTFVVPNDDYNEYFYSGELPWRDNASNVSCIPTGTYRAVWSFSPRFKRYMYELAGVPNRTGIRIHSANFMGDDSKGFKRQLNGCISLGEKLGVMDGQRALLVSSPAVRRFQDLMKGQPFELEIK